MGIMEKRMETAISGMIVLLWYLAETKALNE